MRRYATLLHENGSTTIGTFNYATIDKRLSTENAKSLAIEFLSKRAKIMNGSRHSEKFSGIIFDAERLSGTWYTVCKIQNSELID